MACRIRTAVVTLYAQDAVTAWKRSGIMSPEERWLPGVQSARERFPALGFVIFRSGSLTQ